MLAGPEKGFDNEVLLDPLKEELCLSALPEPIDDDQELLLHEQAVGDDGLCATRCLGPGDCGQ